LIKHLNKENEMTTKRNILKTLIFKGDNLVGILLYYVNHGQG